VKRRGQWETTQAQNYSQLFGESRTPSTDHAGRMQTAASLLQGAHTILDVGCGIGHLLSALPSEVDYLGVDGSEAMLAQARLAWPERTFVCRDILALDDIGAYEAVCNQSVLIHLSEARKPLQHMWTHTTTWLVFSLPIGPKPSIEVITYPGTTLWWHTYTLEEVLECVATLDRNAGIVDFRVLSISSKESPTDHRRNVYFKVAVDGATRTTATVTALQKQLPR
jgi:SAM-dependent methyltransferase